MNFYIQKTWIKLAVSRGLQIEIIYGSGCLEQQSASQRKIFLMNAMQLTRLCKGGRFLIIASEATSIIYMRSPTDVHLLAKLFGIQTQDACHATI